MRTDSFQTFWHILHHIGIMNASISERSSMQVSHLCVEYIFRYRHIIEKDTQRVKFLIFYCKVNPEAIYLISYCSMSVLWNIYFYTRICMRWLYPIDRIFIRAYNIRYFIMHYSIIFILNLIYIYMKSQNLKGNFSELLYCL